MSLLSKEKKVPTIVANGPQWVVCGVWGETKEEIEANAELICRAVNSHEAMKEAVEHCLKVFESMADRGRYPLELTPNGPYRDEHGPQMNTYFLGKQGLEFITHALALAEGKEGEP